MDEYAYGFTTENAHYGPTRNPHDLARVAGGSSGGSGAALAAGLVPLTLGTDTNGSIRVPASLCGVFGLKPTYGRVSRAGAVLFAGSFDHVGPLARSVDDLAVAFDALQGPDPEDPVCSERPAAPVVPALGRGVDGLRIAVAEDYFAEGAEPEALEAVAAVAKALGVTRGVTFPEPHRARAAAMVITAAEGAHQHLELLRTRAADFDPLTRDRFLAGALVPAALVLRAQRFRAWYRARVRELFHGVDVVLAPTTPCVAPLIGKTDAGSDRRDAGLRPRPPGRLHPAALLHRPARDLRARGAPGQLAPRRAARGRTLVGGDAVPRGRRPGVRRRRSRSRRSPLADRLTCARGRFGCQNGARAVGQGHVESAEHAGDLPVVSDEDDQLDQARHSQFSLDVVLERRRNGLEGEDVLDEAGRAHGAPRYRSSRRGHHGRSEHADATAATSACMPSAAPNRQATQRGHHESHPCSPVRPSDVLHLEDVPDPKPAAARSSCGSRRPG